LLLEAKIPLGKVSGRTDHFAIDLERRRLFVAELGNNSVGVIDLNKGELIRNIAGLKEPQGVAYEKSTDTLFVASAGDGSLRLFRGAELANAGRIELGEDADNIRVDKNGRKVFVGYGAGALAVIDPATRTKLASIPLPAHPESFQLDSSAARIFVNLPEVRQIAVVNIPARKVSATWPMKEGEANFPMAIDRAGEHVLAVFRKPASLVAFSMGNGLVSAKVDTCGDADDIFIDPERDRVYVSCGEGFIDVFESRTGDYKDLGRVKTVAGARTSFFAPELDRLFVGVRATPSEDAAVWVFRPAS
jgi:DNA-binding beta-propeller fold protein YncE